MKRNDKILHYERLN
ncbi:TPA: hypothetical protein OF439_002769 [Escherichia coli]|nr:hypothetical protein [Escherichia coli]EKK1017357.1 hypothetical protein [Escherichia coli]HCP7531584.1 hypothetical protein [Escherichia coli]HCP7665732.1 hypothetical protein [Escherichia coli]HCP8146628.1 hypothetical protein [Escherichia coli]